MKTYNIYMPPDAGADSDISAAIYLPDDRSWFAILLPPVWLLWNRMWWGFAVYIAFMTIIFLLLLTPWAYAVTLLSALPGLFLFLEAHNLVCQKYQRKGWWQIGLVHAAIVEEAELRFVLNRDRRSHLVHSGDNIGSQKTAQSQNDRAVNPASAPAKGTYSPSAGLFPLDDTT